MFTGEAVVKKVAEGLFRITGLSLASGASGTISLDTGAGEVKLHAPEWGVYDSSGEQGGEVGRQDSIECRVIPADATAIAAVGAQTPAVVKTFTGPVNFLITLTNRNAAEAQSGLLEIYVGFH